MPTRKFSFHCSTRAAQRQAKIHIEAEAWRAIPEALRHQYHNHFVAVHDGRIIGHDANRLLLYRRVREKLGDAPVFITPADAPHPREFQILSPHLVSNND